MQLSDFIPYFVSVIDELKSSTEEADAFRLKNYKKWHKLLVEAVNEEDIDIESAEDIDELSIPDKMKVKMQEIFKAGSINGQKVEIKPAPKPLLLPPKPKSNLQDFYGFGETTSRKFQDENGVNGDDLLDDWQAYIAECPENEIIMLSKRPRPSTTSKQAWEA